MRMQRPCNRPQSDGMVARMQHGAQPLRSAIDPWVEGVLLACYDTASTTNWCYCCCAKRLSKRLEVWLPRDHQRPDAPGCERGGSAD